MREMTPARRGERHQQERGLDTQNTGVGRTYHEVETDKRQARGGEYSKACKLVYAQVHPEPEGSADR